MSRTIRMALARWALGVIIAALTLLMWPQTSSWSVLGWLVAGSVAATVGVIHYLGLNDFELGKISILPTAAMMAYFALGLEIALAAVTVGLLAWGVLHTLYRSTGPQGMQPWWQAAGNAWLAIAQNGTGLLAAALATRNLGGPLPLPASGSMQQLLPIVAALVLYLLAYNLVLFADTLLRGFKPYLLYERYQQIIPALQILPIALAPFAAVAYANMGIYAFLFVEVILVTLAIVTKRLALTQDSLHGQIEQLARLNEISATLNSSHNPVQVLRLVVTSAIEVADCDRAAIYLLDGGDRSTGLLLTEVHGFSPEFTVRPASETLPLSAPQRHAVLHDGETIRVENIAANQAGVADEALQTAASEGVAACACLPLTAQDECIGLLAVFYAQPQTFHEGELELVEIFANQAALAITNARVFHRVDHQLTRRTGQMARMVDVSQWLNATLDLNAIFEFIVDAAMQGCAADAGMLLLSGDPDLGEADDSPRMVAWHGFDTANRRPPHRVAEELYHSGMLASTEPRVLSLDDPAEPGPRSQLSVPIILDGQTLGAIVLESERLNAFSGEDLRFVEQLTVQAAAAIRNGQLYRHAQLVRDRLHATLDASSDGLLMIDSQARIVMANARMEDFWEFARAEATMPQPSAVGGMDTLRTLSEGLGYREHELERLLEEGRRRAAMPSRRDLYVAEARGGQRQRYVERAVRPVYDDEGQFIGLLLVLRDVTEQKELEQVRKDLISMVVHELRSPLQAVMGSMRLIEEITTGENPTIQQAIGVSRRAVNKLLNLVNNLLDVSRMEQGEFVLDPALERVEPLLEDAAEELMPLAAEIEVDVTLDIATELPYVQIDREMIDRVVLNLLDNALKYTTPGTAITLHADYDREPNGRLSGASYSAGTVTVSVVDCGPGVPDEFKTLIFDRFTQIPGRRGRRRSAGLGLAFCKLAVESHGGRIWVEDNPGGGSIFRFSLPAATPPQHPDEADEPQPSAASRP